MDNTTQEAAQTQPPQESRNGRSRMIFLIIGLAVLVIGLTYIATLAQNRQQPPAQPTPTTATPTPTDETGNWKTYKNEELQYEFKYPPDPLEPQRMMGDTSFVIGYPLKEGVSAKDINTYWITLGYVSQKQLSVRGATYCDAYLNDKPRCESFKISKDLYATIDWSIPVEYNDYTNDHSKPQKAVQVSASVSIPHPNGGIVTFGLQPVTPQSKKTLYQILSTFRFEQALTTSKSPTPTCIPRPACLDATPRCLLPEPAEGWCKDEEDNQVACTQEAKQCPDGSFVGRTGPNCEFALCP